MAERDGTLDLDDLRIASAKRGITRLPVLVGRSLRLVGEAAPRDLALTTAIQLATAVALAFQVLIMRDLLTTLLAGEDAEGFRRAIPSIVALTTVTSAVAVLGIVRTARERIMGELVARFAEQLSIVVDWVSWSGGDGPGVGVVGRDLLSFL